MLKIHISTLLSLALIALVSCSPDRQAPTSQVSNPMETQIQNFDSTRLVITNPVIPGFNPDPCMIRVDEDYYIVTSTFEWFPGIPIYHSKDLASWEPIGHVLTRESQADLRGIGSSSGIYAPSIHYHKGRFYVLYTIVSGDFFPNLATPNYIVWADNISGPWSDPVYINSTGFDPALYFDDDGRCYYMNMLLDFNSDKVTGGITMQDFDIEALATTSEPVLIFRGTMHGTEGPRIYKRNGYYFLLTAEGGTDWNHQVTVCRSTQVGGPFEVAPNTPLLSSRDHPEHPLQRAGHASWVETPDGEWYMAHLASRPLMPERKSVLGRETCIQKLEWIDDWPMLKGGGSLPYLSVEGPKKGAKSVEPGPFTDEFEGKVLLPVYQTLRLPMDPSWVSLSIRPGFLALKGRKPFTSRDDQSLVARRITSLNGRVETALDYEPVHYRNLAGLVCLYDIRDFVYLNVSYDDSIGKYLGIIQHSAQGSIEPYERVSIPRNETIRLAMEISYDKLQFSYSLDGASWTDFGEPFDFTQFSDENNRYGFTGSMVGVCTQDLVNEKLYAYFDYFNYEPR